MLNQSIEYQHQRAIDQFYIGLMPDDDVYIDQWADDHRQLSEKESPEHGNWKTKRVPYLRVPMRKLSRRELCKEVVLMFGAQLGKTETGNNWTGHNIDRAPGPMLSVQPTVDVAKRYSRQRIGPMIQATPKLREKVSEVKSRDSGNTTLSKEFPGGILILTGANSAAGLRSMPIRYLNLDEIDAYPEDCDGEGDPCELAVARTRNFARKKILYTSTPTFEGRSRISTKFNEGSQNYYHVPCPHCKEKQVLKFKNLKWDKGDPESAKYMCEHCSTLIDEGFKTYMLENGEWIAENPEAADFCESFHLSSLYSPLGWFSWGEIARQWINAQGNDLKLRTFVNTVLAETWKEKGEAPDWKKLYDRRESYKTNTVPDSSIVFLTAGVDVQQDRLEVEVVGWNQFKQSWSVDYRQIQGDPEDKTSEGPWAELDKVLDENWEHPNGVSMSIVKMGIDESYKTQVVRSWVRSKSSNRIISIRGVDNSPLLLGTPKFVDVDVNGRSIKRGLKYWPVGVGVAKSELYGWLNQESPTTESGESYPPGYCHFPEYDDEYFKGLTAEQIVVRVVKGYRRYMWEKTRDRNEPLDLRIYARAAASAYGMDRFKPERWADLLLGVARVVKSKHNERSGSDKAQKSNQKPDSFWK